MENVERIECCRYLVCRDREKRQKKREEKERCIRLLLGETGSRYL